LPNPVVHFEIQSTNPEGLHKFYGELFGWHIDASNPINYGLVDTHTDKGIGGGIGGKQDGAPTWLHSTSSPTTSGRLSTRPSSWVVR
jgi:predicted enzyme related to lactoylglutathione lyase